jgi:hypothetical protein
LVEYAVDANAHPIERGIIESEPVTFEVTPLPPNYTPAPTPTPTPTHTPTPTPRFDEYLKPSKLLSDVFKVEMEAKSTGQGNNLLAFTVRVRNISDSPVVVHTLDEPFFFDIKVLSDDGTPVWWLLKEPSHLLIRRGETKRTFNPGEEASFSYVWNMTGNCPIPPYPSETLCSYQFLPSGTYKVIGSAHFNVPPIQTDRLGSHAILSEPVTIEIT